MKRETLASLSILALAACTDNGTGSGSGSGMTDPTQSATTGMSAGDGSGDEAGDGSGATSGTPTTGEDDGSGTDPTDPTAGEDGGSGTDPTDPTAGETGGELDPLEVCQAYEIVYDECFFPQYAREEFCDDYTLGYLDPSEVCGEARIELWACLSQLDCKTLENPADVPCRSVYENANQACPENFGPCADEGNDWPSPGSCYYEFTQCLDDATYRIDCEAQGSTSICTCTIDGAPVGTFDVETDDPACYGEDYRLGAEDLCGFPNYLIPLD